MSKKIVMGFLCLCGSVFLYGMDSGVRCDYFSKLPNYIKGKFVFSLLQGCDDIKAARRVLLSTALVSTKSYELINSSLFTQDVIRFLVYQFNEPHGNIALKLKTQGTKKYKQLNDDCLLATITGNFNKKSLSYISELIDQGADPHFSSLRYGTTLLMKAVRVNSPDFVLFLLDKGVDVHTCDHKQRSARSFNLIYNEKQLKGYLCFIIDYMLKLETHNVVYPDKLLKCEEEIFADVNARELRKALDIDKFLEDRGVKPSFASCFDHPLLILLAGRNKGPIIKRALQAVYSNDNALIWQCVPRFIRSLLYVVKK